MASYFSWDKHQKEILKLFKHTAKLPPEMPTSLYQRQWPCTSTKRKHLNNCMFNSLIENVAFQMYSFLLRVECIIIVGFF